MRVIRSLLLKNGGHKYLAAGVTIIDVYAFGDFLERFDLTRLQHGYPSLVMGQGQLQRLGPL